MAEATITYEFTFTNDQMNKLYDFLSTYCDQMVYEANLFLAEKCYEEAHKISKYAIDYFYGAYSPHLYSRTGSLYDIFDIQVSGDDFIFAYDSDLMGWHRSNEAVLELDFMQGYHGGSRWRTPPTPDRTVKTDKGYKYALHSWEFWHPAAVPVSLPPYDIINILWSNFLHSEYHALQKQAIHNVSAKYAKLV